MVYSHNDPDYRGSLNRRARQLQFALVEANDFAEHISYRLQDIEKQSRELEKYVPNKGYKRGIGTLNW